MPASVTKGEFVVGLIPAVTPAITTALIEAQEGRHRLSGRGRCARRGHGARRHGRGAARWARSRTSCPCRRRIRSFAVSPIWKWGRHLCRDLGQAEDEQRRDNQESGDALRHLAEDEGRHREALRRAASRRRRSTKAIVATNELHRRAQKHAADMMKVFMRQRRRRTSEDRPRRCERRPTASAPRAPSQLNIYLNNAQAQEDLLKQVKRDAEDAFDVEQRRLELLQRPTPSCSRSAPRRQKKYAAAQIEMLDPAKKQTDATKDAERGIEGAHRWLRPLRGLAVLGLGHRGAGLQGHDRIDHRGPAQVLGEAVHHAGAGNLHGRTRNAGGAGRGLRRRRGRALRAGRHSLAAGRHAHGAHGRGRAGGRHAAEARRGRQSRRGRGGRGRDERHHQQPHGRDGEGAQRGIERRPADHHRADAQGDRERLPPRGHGRRARGRVGVAAVPRRGCVVL